MKVFLACVCMLFASSIASGDSPPSVIRTMTVTPAQKDIYTEFNVGTGVVINQGTLAASSVKWILIDFPTSGGPNTADIISSELEFVSNSSSGFYQSEVYNCGRNWSNNSTTNDAVQQISQSQVGYPDRVENDTHFFYKLYSHGGSYAITVNDAWNSVSFRSSEYSSQASRPKWHITYYAEDAKPGDANADGVFDSADLVQVFLAGEYESGENAFWSEGDWNDDDRFTSADFVAALTYNVYAGAEGVMAAWAELNE